MQVHPMSMSYHQLIGKKRLVTESDGTFRAKPHSDQESCVDEMMSKIMSQCQKKQKVQVSD
jgi:hypothetical protein